jgi:hypothetical protein
MKSATVGVETRDVDFSQGQGDGGILRRRSSATPHKGIPNVNAEIAEKRHSYITNLSSLYPALTSSASSIDRIATSS